MKRKMFFGERMMLGDGTEPFHAVIPFRLRGTFTEEEIHEALRRLQVKHPLLNARVTYDEQGMPYFNFMDAGGTIPLRIVDRSAEDQWQQESLLEWKEPFQIAEKPLMRMVWIKGADVSDMLFTFHHCLCDGGSAMSVLSEFLQVLSDPGVDIGLEKPILGIDDIVPEKRLSSPAARFKANALAKLLFFVLKCVPKSKRKLVRGDDYLLHWALDAGVTAQLLAYCKSVGVTVNTFLAGAVLEAFANVQGKQAFNKISCPVDIRRFADQIKDDHIFAFGLVVVMSAYKKLAFEDNLRAMQRHVLGKIAKLEPYSNMMVLESAHADLDVLSSFLKQSKPSNDCMFSNLGRIQIPQQYRTFFLEKIFSPSVIGPLGNTTTLVTSTFAGEIGFSFIGSEGYLPYVQAANIRDQITDIIQRRIKMKQQYE